MLPIVLYKGRAHWNAATHIADLIKPPLGGLQEFTPHFKYLLLDESVIDESGPWALRNLAAALFRLEKIRTIETMGQAVSALTDWIGKPKQLELREAFTVWMRCVLLPSRLPGVTLPELRNLQEISTMLSDNVIDWTQQWKQQGLSQGLSQGKLEGKYEEANKSLKRLLTKRFGPLTDATSARLATASLEQLETWFDRGIDAPTLAAVFDAH